VTTTAVKTAPTRPYDVARIRDDFPILRETAYGKPLVYLDNAATAQKPRQVIEAIDAFYRQSNSNVHRGVHLQSQRATAQYEEARDKVRAFLGARESREIVFVRGATEGLNLVMNSFARGRVGKDDEILITGMEHHSNIVPWQLLCEQTGATLRVVPITDEGEISLDEYEALLGEQTKIVSIVHVSNSLGTINPVKEMVAKAHAKGIPVVVDGAQAVPHMAVDVQDLDCDFYVLSGHKMFGPTGIGALYGKATLLEAMPPWQGGGDMILSVTFEKTTYNEIPFRFEAGTPSIADSVGLGAAIDYLNGIGLDAIARYEHELLEYATAKLSAIDGLRIIGTAREKASVVSFTLRDIHPHDIGTIVDREGVAIRTGHHCTQPVMKRFGVPATARASLAFYNTKDDVDALVRALEKTLEVFG